MADYKLYFLDGRGRVAHRVDLTDCRDEDHAVERVAEHAKDASFGMELWAGGRLVRRFEKAARENSPPAAT